MSLDGNCGKSCQTTLIVCVMLPVGVVCVCRASIIYSHLELWLSPLGIVPCLLQGVADVLQGFLPIYPAGLGETHQYSSMSCPYWWVHGPIHPKCVLWVCSQAIFRASPPWRRCPAEVNQGLPEHGQVWRYHLGSGSYPEMLPGKWH